MIRSVLRPLVVLAGLWGAITYAHASGSLGALPADTSPAADPVSAASSDDFYSRSAMGPVSLWRAGLGRLQQPSCRFIPSCSLFAAVAMRRYGVLAGWVMAMDRYERCHSWAAEDGYPVLGPFFLDPVPRRW